MYDKDGLTAFLRSFVDFDTDLSFLDLGCGKGGDLLSFAAYASPQAFLTGIDMNEKSIAEANASAAADSRMRFLVHDLETDFPFPDESFDVVFSRNVLECIVDKARFARELHRVLKPGGKAIISHFDWDSQLFNAVDKSLHRSIMHTYNDWQQPWMAACDAWIGRRLNGIFGRTGLFDGATHPFVLTETKYEPGYRGFSLVREEISDMVEKGILEGAAYAQFDRELSEVAATGEYFYSINLYAYVGTKRVG